MNLGTVGFVVGFSLGAIPGLRFGLRNRRNAAAAEKVAWAEGKYYSPNESTRHLFQLYFNPGSVICSDDSLKLKKAKQDLLDGLGKHPILRIWGYAIIGVLGAVAGAMVGTIVQDGLPQ